MNRHRPLRFVMAVVSFVLLWEGGFANIFDVGDGNAWAKQTPNLTPSTVLSPGRDLGPISLTLRTSDDSLRISRREPMIPPIHGTTSLKLAAHVPNETEERSVRHNSVAKRAPATEKKSFEYRDGRLSLEANQRPISELLGQISAAAGVEIVIFDPIDSGTISVSIKDRPVEEALRTILKGCSYSVVYNPKREDQGVRIVQQPKTRVLQNGSTIAPALASFGSEGAQGPAQKEAVMEVIARIEERIASGESDREYEKWSKVRGPQYVTHDRDKLEHYKKELANFR